MWMRNASYLSCISVRSWRVRSHLKTAKPDLVIRAAVAIVTIREDTHDINDNVDMSWCSGVAGEM